MASEGWTIRFRNYYPVDERMEERLQRVCAELDRLPESALTVDQDARVVTIDYAQVRGCFESSREVLRAVRVGQHTVVKPPWVQHAADAGDLVLEIDPGHSFGSGLHETTRLCLGALEKRIVPGSAVVDFGSGSGVLAIAAAKLGAGSVWAVESNPEAAAAAGGNVERNGAAAVVGVLAAEDLSGIAPDVDMVTANVPPDVLFLHLPEIARVLRTGGLLVCSGVTSRQADDLRRHLSDAGFALEEELKEGHWLAFVAVKT